MITKHPTLTDKPLEKSKVGSELTTPTVPALVASPCGLSPAGGAGKSGRGRSSGQGRRRNLRHHGIYGNCIPSTSPYSTQGLVDAALSRKLPANFLHSLTDHLIFELVVQERENKKRSIVAHVAKLVLVTSNAYFLHVRGEPSWGSLIFFFCPFHFFHDYLLIHIRE